MRQLQALAARDASVSRRVAIGVAEARQGQLDSSIGTLSSVLADAPNDSRVLVAIARVYLLRAERSRDRNDASLARASAVLERALGGTAPRSEGLALFGRALHLAGNDVDAERILRDAIATSPVHPEAFLFLADTAERLGHDLAARNALMNLDMLQGDTVSAAVRNERARRIGELSLRAGDARAAADYLSRAVDAGHDGPATLGLLAHARWLTGDAASARELLDRALAASPRDSQLQRLARIIR
jgi:predicted Zn-dependent protease